MKVKLLHKDAKTPFKSTKQSSGYDVVATKDVYVWAARGVIKVPLGIAIEVPPGYELQIRSKSSLAAKGLMLANGIGTIDSDYRGEITALLYMLSGDIKIKKGEKIVQLVVQKIPDINIEQVDDLSNTERGSGGFGSTGK